MLMVELLLLLLDQVELVDSYQLKYLQVQLLELLQRVLQQTDFQFLLTVQEVGQVELIIRMEILEVRVDLEELVIITYQFHNLTRNLTQLEQLEIQVIMLSVPKMEVQVVREEMLY
jgi:hypothetical protein